MIFGDAEKLSDLQQELHRDTFHPSFKLWFFLDDCKDEQGFCYVKNSHLLSAPRKEWEYKQSVEASIYGAEDTGGSFRINDAELIKLGLNKAIAFQPKANSLLIANTFGFHCRGEASPNAQRKAIYASLRPSPFLLWPF